jgi:S-(hydroxymethyl)glutathione dehydrogenase/alcohol dehydrogenase
MIKGIAAYLEKIKRPLKIETIHISEPDFGQVLVKVINSSICGRQISEINGSKGKDKFLPHLLGHEGSGEVVKIGKGVRKLKKGDKVVMHWRPGSGISSNFPSYKNMNGKNIGGGLITTFNQYALVSENRLTKIPKNTPYDLAALMGCAASTALSLINNEAKVKIGESVLIIGSGGVGLNLILASKLVSAFPIVVTDINKKKLNLAKTIGADEIFNFENIKKLERKFDVIIDTSGNTKAIEFGYNNISDKYGRLVMVGQPDFKSKIVFNNASKNFTGKKIIDSQGGQFDPDKDLPNYIKLILNKRIRYKQLITNRVKIRDINLAIKKIKSGQILGKCIVELF